MSGIIKNSSIFPLFEDYPNMFVKQTVESLFKTLLETVMDVRTESVIILKSSSLENIDGVLTRLSYSNAKIFSFSNNQKYKNFRILDDRKDVFEEDFLLIFSERFSVVLAWMPTETKGFLNACTSLNSGIINNIFEVMKLKADYKEVVNEVNNFNLDRRGNVMFDTILNKLLLKVEEQQRDLLCASSELKDADILEEKDVRNILKNFSHELRNPVGMLGIYWKILSGYIEKIEQGDNSSEPFEMIENATEVISGALNNIENTLSDMSNYTRDFELNLSKENISELVGKVVSFALPSFRQKGIELFCDIKNENLFVNIDKYKIYQVMLNLLKNALEATDSGKNVYVTVDEVDNETIIKIEDEGCGIKPEILPKIFRAYFTTKEDGSGIGLSLAKTIIEKHGGELTLVKNSENGCAFQINLR